MKKTKLFLSLLLVFAGITAFIFTKTETETVLPPPLNNNISSDFLIGAMDGGIDNNYDYLPQLNFNLWHKYIYIYKQDNGSFNTMGWDWYSGNGWNQLDQLDAINTQYQSVIQGRLDQNVSPSHPMRTLMQRPKTERLCFGQRSNYQCEVVAPTDGLWFYSFNTHETGRDVTDSGQTVRLCLTSNDGPNWDYPGYVVKSLKCNNEQCNTSLGNRWEGDKIYDWYIKPRIRIDSMVAHDPQNPLVCNIKVVKSDGTTLVKNVDIHANDFLVDGTPTPQYYNGRYIEEFNFPGNNNQLLIQQTPISQPGNAFNPVNSWPNSRLNNTNQQGMDIQVYWYGNCDMWIDYVRVDNDVANDLMNPNSPNYNTYNDWLQWEASLANYNNSPIKFYIEEFEFNNIPCMSYVSRYMRAHTNNDVNLMCDLNQGTYEAHVNFNANPLGASHIERFLIDSVGLTQIFAGIYPFKGEPGGNSKVPNTLTTHPYDTVYGFLGNPCSPAVYDNWLQTELDDYNNGDPWKFTNLYKLMDTLSKARNIPFINLHQAFLWWSGTNYWSWREPSNEEMDMILNLAVTYGAKGNLYFMYGNWGCLPKISDPDTYGRGLTNPPASANCTMPMEENRSDLLPRTWNVYGQRKWDKIISMDQRLKTWSPYLMSFDNTNRHSYIYRIPDERTAFNNTYFNQLIAYMPDPYDFNTPSTTYDDPNTTYLQGAVFEKDNDNNYYFMIVNRRCSPVTQYDAGGTRYITAKFDAVTGSSPKSWKIINLEDNALVATINRSAIASANLGRFNPGEGKLYKMEPVLLSGGDMVSDEPIPSGSYTILDTIFTNGYNLTIEEGAHLYFTDTSTIVVEGGKFTAGTVSEGQPNVFFSAAEDNTFHGLNFTGGAEVKIYKSSFSGIANDTTYAVNIISCPLIDIRNSSFTSGSNTLSGAINITYYSEPVINNIYIGGNTFDAGTSSIPFVNLMSYAGTSTPALIENNTFTSTSGACGLMLSGVTGGAVKSNTFTNFGISVTALSSSIDVYGNTFTNESATSTGIEALSGTELRLNKVGSTFIGGRNSFSNNQSSSRNITVDYSYYLLDGGENIFNIGSDNESRHLRGTFPDIIAVSIDETYNCFKISQSVSTPVVDVTSGSSPVSFVFTPYLSGCDPNGGGDEMVINLGNGIYDTVSMMPGSGGESSINNEALRLRSGLANQLYDSICIQMRYRNYSYVKDRCTFMLNAYPDSVESIYAAHKLYLAVSVTDTTTSGKTALKTLFETLILNNPNNTALVKKCNYLVQKCKVLLHQYSSALAGFQQIVNNNPYSYEGLVAHWDYMATSLLIQGGAGSISNFGLSIANLLSDKSDKFEESDELFNDPNDKFTKEERKQINKTVTQSYETTRESGQKKIETLSKQASEGNTESAKQIKQMRTLEQVVTIQKPKNLFEHISIVKSDLKRVFGKDNSGNNKNNNIIPTQFMLSQNYPNPFNPATTIKYALPKDVKVVIKIYDILGREVETLVNEFKKAGYYEVKFNGSNFASGVYFYRIEFRQAGSSTGEFVVSKKMVLVK